MEEILPDKKIISLSWYKIWFDCLIHPNKQTAENLFLNGSFSFKRVYLWAVIASFFIGALNSIAFSIKYSKPLDINMVGQVLFDGLITAIITPISTIILIGVIHFVCKIFKRKGNFRDFFIIFIPFTLPFFLLFSLIAVIIQMTQFPALMFVAVLIAFYLLFFLITRVITINYNIHWLGALLINILVQGGLFYTFMFIMMVVLFPYLSTLK
jgi:hypothetical protein